MRQAASEANEAGAPGTTVFLNGDVHTPFRILRRGMVVTQGRSIEYVGPAAELPLGARIIDAGGKIIAPGFVDIHIHGGGGGDFMDATPDKLSVILDHHARHGTTSLLATTCTASMERIYRAFDFIGGWKGKEGAGAEILGIHMEGPHLAKPEPGCHIVDLIHNPRPEELARIVERRGLVRRVTVAPEIEGAMAFIRRLTEEGIVVSGGHSNATYQEVRQGVEAGLTHLTHHWSAMSIVRRVGAKRFAGMVEAGLVCDDLTTEVIADGRHLPSSLLRLAYKCKGAQKLALVSDAMRASGLPEGVYEVCGMDALVEDGVAVTLDRKAFASSIITVEAAVRHMVNDVGISLLDALRMATDTPARIIRAHDRKGSIARGKDADLLVIDPATLQVDKVMVRGVIREDA